MDRGLFFSAVAELTGESSLLLVVLVGGFGAGLDTGAILGWNTQQYNQLDLCCSKKSIIIKNTMQFCS